MRYISSTNDEGKARTMETIRLTRRGQIVLGILAAAAMLGLYALGMEITTPEQCKVSIAEMSEACRSLL